MGRMLQHRDRREKPTVLFAKRPCACDSNQSEDATARAAMVNDNGCLAAASPAGDRQAYSAALRPSAASNSVEGSAALKPSVEWPFTGPAMSATRYSGRRFDSM
jgi:hypothetical protein